MSEGDAPAFDLRTWTSEDGLTLSYRVYPGPDTRLPVICLPGLTRNARDFEDLAPRLSVHRTVFCPDLRGRGRSGYAADPATYQPVQYVRDLDGLLVAEDIARFVSIGNSLGGLLTMMLSALPGLVAGAVLNDIGPVIEEAGLARIRGYVGSTATYADWQEATVALAAAWADVYPDWPQDLWARAAHRVMAERADGRIGFDYDPAIAVPFAATDPDQPQPNLWPLFQHLAREPLLLVRGELSDILAPEAADAMLALHPRSSMITMPNVGHAPTLDEPEVLAAIEALLADLD